MGNSLMITIYGLEFRGCRINGASVPWGSIAPPTCSQDAGPPNQRTVSPMPSKQMMFSGLAALVFDTRGSI